MQIDLSAANDEAAALVGSGFFLSEIVNSGGLPTGWSLVVMVAQAGLAALAVLGVTSVTLSSKPASA